MRLGQLLGYLGRDGISEIVIGTGRPITVKKQGTYQPLLSTALGAQQLEELLRGTPLLAMLPARDTNGAPTPVEVLGKSYQVQIARRGDSVLLKLEPGAASVGASVDAPSSTPSAASGGTPAGAYSTRGARAELSRRPSGELGAVEPGHSGELRAVDPRQSGELRAVDPRHSGELRAVDPRQSGELRAVDPRQSGELRAVDPRQSGEPDAVGGRGDDERAMEPSRGAAPAVVTFRSATSEPPSSPAVGQMPLARPSPVAPAPLRPAPIAGGDSSARTAAVSGAGALGPARAMASEAAPVHGPSTLSSLRPTSGVGASSAAAASGGATAMATGRGAGESVATSRAAAPALAPSPAAAPPTGIDLGPVASLELEDSTDFSLGVVAPLEDSFELELDLSGEELGGMTAAHSAPLPSPAVPSVPSVSPPAWTQAATAPVAAAAAPASTPVPAAAPAVRLPAAVTRQLPEGFVALVAAARRLGATDLHLCAAQPPLARVLGQLVRVADGNELAAPAVAALIEPWLSASERAALEARGYVDLALDVPGRSGAASGRVRCNVSRARGGLRGSFRLAWEGVPTLDTLGLPRELTKVTSYHQGLVVIAGPSGHGKTTTLAALVDLINSSRPHHILCIEDPVEIVHPRKQSVVSQREVGLHTRSFASALRASLREDPDVIVIGEIRDRETVEIALTAAETGHLVIATMSTPSAAKTIDRLIDMFPPDDQTQVRVSLAAALRFIVAQRLLPRKSGQGVVPALELLTGVLPVAALIRDNKLFQLPNLQQRGRAFGMIRFDDSVLELVRSGLIDEEVAVAAAESKREVMAALHPPEPAAAAQPQAKPWDDARQRLGGLFRRDKAGPGGGPGGGGGAGPGAGGRE